MSLHIHSLPLEILQQVAEYVDIGHRPSLQAFSLTSKACHNASVFLIFRKVHIRVRDCEGIQRDVDRLSGVLSRVDSFRHVQRISMTGALLLKGNKREFHDPDKSYYKTSGLDEIFSDEDLMSTGGKYVVYDEAVIKESSEEDMAWAPIVKLIGAICHLKDLVYECQNQFPPSLLRFLHHKHPSCRLHHLTFRFRTLLWVVPYPYEMELATSPSLYRIKAVCAYQDSDGDFDYNPDAIMELVAGLAPNLKEVDIQCIHPIVPSHQRRVRDQPWQGLPGLSSGAVGSLTSLSLKGFHWLSPTDLQSWVKHTDFAKLQHLDLGGGYQYYSCGLSGETMDWIAQNLVFPRLRTLRVGLDRHDTFHERPNYSENAISFFQTFEPLDELFVHGPLDWQIVDVILSHHGRTVRKLGLHPLEPPDSPANGRDRRDIPIEFSKDRLLHIQLQCPALQELSIPIKRSKSSASEVELYKCFSEMQSLRRLFLHLDCSNWRISRDSTYDPGFSEEDSEIVYEGPGRPWIKKGHLKEALINCAVDRALARSIWNAISDGKKGRPLERLKLWTTGGGDWPDFSKTCCLCCMVDNLSRAWVLERTARQGQQEIMIREPGQSAREASERESWCVAHEKTSEVWRIFRSIWPRKTGSKGWQEDWSSFPLEI